MRAARATDAPAAYAVAAGVLGSLPCWVLAWDAAPWAVGLAWGWALDGATWLLAPSLAAAVAVLANL